MTERDRLRKVASLLSSLETRIVFVGGMVRGLLSTDPAAPPPRATKDVDVVIDVTSLSELQEINVQLRQRGFTECTDEGAPLCRWVLDEELVDIMPVEPGVLGFSNVWYPGAIENRIFVEIGSEASIPIVDAPHFVATKLEAFLSRGDDDYYHHDLEDVVCLINERNEAIDEIGASDAPVKRFISETIAALLSRSNFIDALPGHLEGDAASQARLPILLERLQMLASLESLKGGTPEASAPPSTTTPVARSTRALVAARPGAITFPQSTNIAWAQYDDATEVLTVGFHGGRVYVYSGVPKNVFTGLGHAASAGQYHHQWIRGRYTFRRLH